MKHLLTLLCIVVGLNCMGQKQDSIRTDLVSYYGFPGERLPNVDTIHIVMLVSDTSHYIETWMEIEGNKMWGKGHEVKEDHGIARTIPFLKKGYVARRKVSDQFNESFWMETVLIMDENKKPLSPNILIWQSTTLKN